MALASSRRVAHVSLGLPRNGSLLLGFVGLVVGAAMVRGAHVSLQGGRGMLVALVAYGGGGLAGVLVPSWLKRRRELRWLAKLSIPLARDEYLEALGGRAAHAAFAIVAQPRDDSAPVTIRSPRLRTTRAGWSGSYFYNGGLHAWFRETYNTILIAQDRRTRISALHVAFVPDPPRSP